MPHVTLDGGQLKVNGVVINDPKRDQDVSQLLWEIRRERRVELVFEGIRFNILTEAETVGTFCQLKIREKCVLIQRKTTCILCPRIKSHCMSLADLSLHRILVGRHESDKENLSLLH